MENRRMGFVGQTGLWVQVGRSAVVGVNRRENVRLRYPARARRACRLRMTSDDKKKPDEANGSDASSGGGSSGDKAFEQRDEKDFAKIPQSEVDWTSEWVRFQSSGAKSLAGKGKSPTPKVVLQGRKAVNEARMSVQSIQWRALTKDWRFWVACIVALSLLTSLVQVNSLQSSGAL
ncbi:hypothetical protein FVE85_6828 [Porphyridium purpureum]|uniref:Uncharacterized protein n=1 Tax=Porphyridium purpureum TaxID=35688 RepID=A0A5J4Z8Z6_PORPP|nr:hypothetical protein FVE85_6828 [Porphyridium purpureum]|eukprot:POR9592..scf295_1